MKLEDLTDEELVIYINSVDFINHRLCNGERTFGVWIAPEEVFKLIAKLFREHWIIEPADLDSQIWHFKPALKDNDPKRSAWYGPSLRPVS